MKIETFESYTNIFYFFAGIAGFIVSENVIFLLVMTLLSAASFVFHQHKEGHIYKFDWIAMVIAILGIAGILYNSSWFWIGAAIYITIYSYFLVGRADVMTEIGIVCIPLLIAVFLFKPLWLAITILIIFIAAFWIRSYDNHKNARDVHYDSFYHSLWHLITAVGFYLML